ncbi:phytanoyl-CoA dioxygenase family protein [Alkalihalobacillus sp. 1P02AB]|uniref:phytanoyl-CoA dioxygenase family protein n=1 Tax=Alkalihalobacillus sp. 1P02AB TaxID=3132260 RepID=UPI0039A5197B
MLESHKTLPELQSEYNLTEENISNYRESGHIRLNAVAKQEEIDIFHKIINDEVERLNYQTKPLNERDTYGKAFIQIGQLREKSEQVRRFVLARRFAKIAADLMGVEGVRIFHDQALFKEPGGGHTPWHQDQIYWPLETDKTITMWMPLDEISEEMGTMSFISNSHTTGDLSQNLLKISDESHNLFDQYIEKQKLEPITYGAMAAGDATFHSGWTLHSAPHNPTNRMRKTMAIIYYADGAHVTEIGSKERQTNLDVCLPGLKPGDLASTSLNPLVYSSKPSV